MNYSSPAEQSFSSLSCITLCQQIDGCGCFFRRLEWRMSLHRKGQSRVCMIGHGRNSFPGSSQRHDGKGGREKPSMSSATPESNWLTMRCEFVGRSNPSAARANNRSSCCTLSFGSVLRPPIWHLLSWQSKFVRSEWMRDIPDFSGRNRLWLILLSVVTCRQVATQATILGIQVSNHSGVKLC